MAMIEIENIRKTYNLGELGLEVLKGLSLSVADGELIALTGSSGSGKSTLMNILGCLDHPTHGRYRLNGEDVTDLSAKERARVRRRLIGFVFQNFNLLPRTSALENVLMPLEYSSEKISEQEKLERAHSLLDRVGLQSRMDHQPSQLSGGQQQRVAIARSLINKPRVLLADEPTGNLDSVTSKEILSMFQALNRDDGLTIILVTHDPDVARHAGRVIKMRDGLVEDGDSL